MPPPVHGQSLAFKRFYENIHSHNKLVINTNIEQKNLFSKIIGTVVILVLMFYKITFFRIDLVYFTCSRSFFGSLKDVILINLAALKKIKLVNHLHGSDFYEFLHSSPKWYQDILFYSYSKVNVSIVLLDSMKNQFIDFSNMDLEVVVNFYDEECDENIAVKRKDNINLVYLSNIISSKGIFELIDAFEILSKRHDNIYLNIAGGYMSDEYMSLKRVKKEFILRSSRNDRIKYLGKMFDREKVKLLQESDIFVLPTYYKSEAFPISIIEAMACENAIITTNYKYLPEVIGKENGMLVNPKSVESLVEGLEFFLNDIVELRRVQRHNKIQAKNKYGLNRYLKALSKIMMSE